MSSTCFYTIPVGFQSRIGACFKFTMKTRNPAPTKHSLPLTDRDKP